MDDFSPNRFEDVFSAELEEIAKRQEKPNGEAVDRKELAGIALSGGGIRAATSALGVLQALKKLGVLSAFDYLSTVSGGGFAGSWWSAWTSRNFTPDASKEEKFFPPPERTQPERDRMVAADRVSGDKSGVSANAHNAAQYKATDPVHHLRLFSNYLTPMKGMMSADTWRANAVISRNLALTWLVLIPMIFAAVLLAQSYFTVQPNSEMEFLYPYSHFASDNARTQGIDFELRVAKRLDSVVHGGTGTTSLAPIRALRKLGEPETEKKIAAHRDPLALIALDIDSLRRLDSTADVDLGDMKSFPMLQSELNRIEAHVLQWRVVDSFFRADRAFHSEPLPARAAAIQEEKDSLDKAYERILDPDVDSVQVRLIKLERDLIAHREQVRDNWLFNDTHLSYLANRVVWMSHLPIMMLGWIVVMICLWMINSGNRMFGGNVLQGSYAFIGGLIAFNGLQWLVPHLVGAIEPPGTDLGSALLQFTWAAVALVLLNLILWDTAHSFWKKHRKSMDDDAMQQLMKLLDVRRARIVTYHQRLLLGAVIATVLLCFGGFGHEAINYLFFYRSNSSWDLWQWVARCAGIAVIFSALAGTGFAAGNATRAASEAARTGRGNPNPPGKIKSMLIGLAPPLILLLLLCGISWASHWVLQDLVFRTGRSMDQHYIVLIFSMWLFGFLSLYYAVYDLHFRRRKANRNAHVPPTIPVRQFSRLLLVAILFIQVAMMVTAIAYPSQSYRFPIFWIALPLAVWAIVVWKYARDQKNTQPAKPNAVSDASNLASDESFIQKTVTFGSRIRSVGRAGVMAFLILSFSALLFILISAFVEVAELPIDHLFLVALGATVLVLLLDILWGIRAPEDGRRGNHEARLLLGINVTLYTLFLIIPPLSEDPHWGVTHVLEILIALAIGLVIFVGWRVDPNALSIHSFYRNRIVRAYLGASNWFRERSSVSVVNPEDDIPLTKLANCEQGAPYHLINTTLNLLGTKSLETAQRNASNFIFSKRYCGSVTTGFRPTDEYMSSTMTLGTAVAISGAAASPNMGSNQVSGATTMLMSLLNIRLGYWAANPGRARWREAQPALWPYYLLKESLSQTTGFGAFCYLTDGGHFDNTGLYPLIERGCRYIVLCDNGADPDLHYKDLGSALRRCRIDFGAEFLIDGLKEMTSLGGPSTTNTAGKAHWLRGTVKYSEAHLRTLWGDTWDEGLSAEERTKCRTGSILVLKPVLLGDEPVDVLQYGLEYADFPQQSTANQWFSEDQFESYRRLGYWSAQTAFGGSDLRNASRAELLQAVVGTGRSEEKKSISFSQDSMEQVHGSTITGPSVPLAFGPTEIKDTNPI